MKPFFIVAAAAFVVALVLLYFLPDPAAAAGLTLAVIGAPITAEERNLQNVLSRHGAQFIDGPVTGAPWNRLLEVRNSLQRAMNGLIDRAESEGRDGFNEREQEAFDYAVEQVNGINAETEERDRIGNRNPRRGRKSDPTPVGGPNGGGGRRYAASDLQLQVPYAGRYAADMFGPAPSSQVDATDFFRAAIAGRGPGMEILNAYGSEGIGSDGGWGVPPEFAWQLWDASLEGEIVRPRAHVIPMKSATMSVGGLDTLDHTGGSIGGFVGAWAKEGGTFTAQKPKLRSVNLVAKKLGIFGQLTNELIYDSPNLWRDLQPLMASAIGWHMDDACIRGNGAGKPVGVLNDAALITVSKESGQAADTVVASNLLKMYERLHPQCIRGAVWLFSQTLLRHLMTISINVEKGTDGIAVVDGPMLREVAPGSFTMMGLPAIPTEKVPPAGDKGDIILVDWGQYFVGLRQEIIMGASNAPGWSQDLTDFRSIIRAEGLGKWSGPVTPKNGDPLSWCVTLEAR